MSAPLADDLPSLFAFNRWADETVLEALRGLAPEDYCREPVPGWASVRATAVHVADALNVWARRLGGETPTRRATEDEYPTVDELARYFRAGHDAFDRLVATTSPEALAGVWETRDLAGTLYRQPLWSVYRHVVNHGTYHRGQIAAKLKRLGVDLPPTDLVAWARLNTPQQA
jgi:uncharacterized damage-inducible protein DinB